MYPVQGTYDLLDAVTLCYDLPVGIGLPQEDALLLPGTGSTMATCAPGSPSLGRVVNRYDRLANAGATVYWALWYTRNT